MSFYDLLYKKGENIEIRCLAKNKPPRVEFISHNGNTIKQIKRVIKKYNSDYNIYLGVLPRKKQKVATDSDISRINACFVDIDKKDFSGEKAFDNHIKELENGLLPSLKLKPTVKLCTGNGIHYYFILKQKEIIGPDLWREIQKALIEFCKGDKSIKNLSRIMRIPGSQNLKDPNNPKPCKLLWLNPKTYTMKDFETLLEKYLLLQQSQQRQKGKENTQHRELTPAPLPAPRDERDVLPELLNILGESGSGLFNDYESFINFCYGCKAVGLPYSQIDHILRQSECYNYKENEKLYKDLNPDGRRSFSTICYFAKKANSEKFLEVTGNKYKVEDIPLPEEAPPENFSKQVKEPEPTSKIETIFDKIKTFSVKEVIEIKSNLEDDPVIDTLLYREGISIVFGDPGAGKTWLILDLCLKLADGEVVWGNFETTPQKILLLEGDFSLPVLKYRFLRMQECKNLDNFQTLTARQLEELQIDYSLNQRSGQEMFEALLNKMKPDLVIIDSLGSFIGCDESKFTEVKSVIDFLKTQAQKHHNHIMIVHHARKRASIERREGRKLDQSDMIGSSLFMRYATCILSVNAIFDEEGPVKNKGLVANIKNWFKLAPRFEYEIEEDELEEQVQIKYNYDEALINPRTRTEKGRGYVLALLKADPTLQISKKQIYQKIRDEDIKISKRLLGDILRDLIRSKQVKAVGPNKNRIYSYIDPSDIVNHCTINTESQTTQEDLSSIPDCTINVRQQDIVHLSYSPKCTIKNEISSGKDSVSYRDPYGLRDKCTIKNRYNQLLDRKGKLLKDMNENPEETGRLVKELDILHSNMERVLGEIGNYTAKEVKNGFILEGEKLL